MLAPEIRYARRPDGVNIAYAVLGEGPLDLLVSPGFVSHIDLQWAEPGFRRALLRLASFARVIVFDKPGTGLSDPIPYVPAIEERVDDLELLLDEVGSQRAAVFGFSEGGPAAALLAARRPERVRALVVYGSYHRIDRRHPAYAGARAQVDDLLDHWGDGGRAADLFWPSATALQRRTMGVLARAAASPAMARAVIDVVWTIDVSAALPLVQAPTLVLHRRGDSAIPVEFGRAFAEGIAGARYVELEGHDHVPWAGDTDALLGELEAFLTGARHVAEPQRALATVLFTDIVGSTDTAARLGDRAWRELLERHDALSRERVEAFRGRVVKSLGDGVLATFDGPARAVRCAEALVTEVPELGVDLRAGVHTGEVEVMDDDVGGMAVHLGARVSARAGAGEVLVSSTVRDLVVGSDLCFADAGEHELKGVPGRWRLFRLGEEAVREPLPSARETMRLADRAAVRMARRAPRAMRLAGRLAAGRGAPVA